MSVGNSSFQMPLVLGGPGTVSVGNSSFQMPLVLGGPGTVSVGNSSWRSRDSVSR